MQTLLQINSSLNADQGQSSLLANDFVARWLKANPRGKVVVRDLAVNALPHLSADRFQAFITPVEKRSEEQAAHVAVSDQLIEELKAADIVVLGLPMYNFGIPSTLKAWIDHVARAGQTFKYTDNGPVGLLADRKVVVFAARGGLYQGTPKDTQTTYVKDFLNFIGLTDLEFVYAEGLAMGEEQRDSALSSARAAIGPLLKTIKPIAA